MGPMTMEVNVNMTVPDGTINCCIRLLEMWMQDNPGKVIVFTRKNDGSIHGFIDTLKDSQDVVKEGEDDG